MVVYRFTESESVLANELVITQEDDLYVISIVPSDGMPGESVFLTYDELYKLYKRLDRIFKVR